MQWDALPNAGFSAAKAKELYCPVITDPVYNYQAVNVVAQERIQSSLLNRIRRCLELRQHYGVFGRGDIRFVEPRNPSVLAYIRH